MCPPEKRLRSAAFDAEQSILRSPASVGNNREIRALSEYFGVDRAELPCSPDCVAGRDDSNLGTGLNGVRADVCVSYAKPIFYPDRGCRAVSRYRGKPVRFLARSKSRMVGDFCGQKLSLRHLSSGQVGSHVTACLPRSQKRKLSPQHKARPGISEPLPIEIAASPVIELEYPRRRKLKREASQNGRFAKRSVHSR
jgi:hypothetical protein